MLNLFKWDMYTLTPWDFVQHIIPRLPEDLWGATQVTDMVRTCMAYCATGECNFGFPVT